MTETSLHRGRPDETVLDALEPFALDPGRPVARQVFDFLREQIMTARLPPDTALSENSLCLRLGVSRQPVREALLRLAGIDLVRTYAQRGSVVTRISVARFRRAQLIREAVESDMVARACASGSAAFLRALGKELVLQQAFAEYGDIPSFQESDNRFHELILSEGDAPGLWEELAGLRSHLDRVRHLTLRSGATLQRLLADHTAVHDGLAARDAAAAAAAMRHHLRLVLVDFREVAQRLPDFFTQEA